MEEDVDDVAKIFREVPFQFYFFNTKPARIIVGLNLASPC